MSWKRLRRVGLRQALLWLLVPGLAAVTLLELWTARQDAIEAANAAYDRSVQGAIESIRANVSTASGGLAVELPYRMFEFFQLTASGTVHFRVATADGLVEIGSPDLPLPAHTVPVGETAFYDATYFGEAVRVGYTQRPLDRALAGSESPLLVIQVAESTRSREAFTRRFLWRAALRDGAVLLLTLLAVAWAVSHTTRPVSRLAAQVKSREPSDLTPLASEDLPADIAPLVDAVNQQMARTSEVVERRRAFLDDASHQLRTPLATLRTQLDFAGRVDDAAALKEVLDAVSRQVDVATRNTNQLLALARSETAEVRDEPLDLVELARSVVLDLLPQARAKSLDIGIDAAEDARMPAHGDTTLLREALSNLVHNAIRHAPPGGEVTVQPAQDALGFGLAVLDSGPGVPEDVLPRLGDRFVRSPTSGGSGLGLAIARSIAQRHGGSLRAGPREDKPGFRAALWWPRR